MACRAGQTLPQQVLVPRMLLKAELAWVLDQQTPAQVVWVLATVKVSHIKNIRTPTMRGDCAHAEYISQIT